MKKSILLTSSIFLIAGITLSALAVDQAALKPCRNIIQACKNAGFVKGGVAQGKGILENCLTPIMSGQTVPGVTVDPADVQGCQALKAKMLNK